MNSFDREINEKMDQLVEWAAKCENKLPAAAMDGILYAALRGIAGHTKLAVWEVVEPGLDDEARESLKSILWGEPEPEIEWEINATRDRWIAVVGDLKLDVFQSSPGAFVLNVKLEDDVRYDRDCWVTVNDGWMLESTLEQAQARTIEIARVVQEIGLFEKLGGGERQ